MAFSRLNNSITRTTLLHLNPMRYSGKKLILTQNAIVE